MFAKLLSIPILQTGKSFSDVYPEGKDWIKEFIDKGISPGDARRFREGIGYYDKEKWITYIIEHRLNLDKRSHEYFFIYRFAEWIEKDKEKVEIVRKRLNTYFTFELDYEGWRWTGETMPKTPEDALDWFLYYYEEN